MNNESYRIVEYLIFVPVGGVVGSGPNVGDECVGASVEKPVVAPVGAFVVVFMGVSVSEVVDVSSGVYGNKSVYVKKYYNVYCYYANLNIKI